MDGPVAKLLSAEEIRRTAEARFLARPPAARTGPEAEALLHELGVHQIELEMQNEQLRQTQVELASSRDRYSTLYDQAPVGYVTIDRNAAVVECNLAAAELLGAARDRLLGLELTSLMSEGDADRFYLHRLALLRDGKGNIELDLRRASGTTFRARLDSVTDGLGGAGPRFRTALIDITELRAAQADLHASEARFQQIAAHI